MAFSFARLWQQSKLSDVELAIRVQPADGGADSTATQTLQTFPAHSVILSHSPVLEAQVLWKTEKDEDDTAAPAADTAKKVHQQQKGSSASASTTTAAAAAAKRQVVLTLQSESQQLAALAVLAAMYGVKPVAELLSALPQEQQLDAAIVADMLQLPTIADAAVQVLVTASKGAAGLTATLIKHYLQLQVYPSCLLPLLPCVLTVCAQPDSTAEQKAGVKRVLLSVLGDLEEVWADAALRDTLLQLPLPAMELLLSYDELKVASEDTVLFTAQAYISSLPLAQRSEAKKQLAPLIRCPHLSLWWLAVSAGSDDTANLLLSEFQPQLRQLQMMLHSKSDSAYTPTSANLEDFLSGAPPAWALPRRVIREAVSSVQLVWMADVGAIRDAVTRCASKQCTGEALHSPHRTPSLGGISFGLLVQPYWDAEAKGVKLGVYGVLKHVPDGAAFNATFSISAGGVTRTTTAPLMDARGTGWRDFFNLGILADGWDEAAWTAKKLPANGQLKITLTVTGVGHCKVHSHG